MPFMAMQHTDDPRQTILDAVGDLSTVEVCYSQILVGIYIRPKKTKSGLYLSDQTVDEDKYQSKTALVLKLGPLAFQNSADIDFQGFSVNPGDWIVLRASDGWPLSVHGQDCRMISDAGVRMVVQSPDEVF
jgi:co-chaperonin GroES (HSP10)